MYSHLASRVFDTPLAIMPEKAEIILSAIGPRLGITSLQHADGTVQAISSEAKVFEGEEQERSGYRVEGGVAIIPIHGTLVQRHGWLNAMSGMTSYEHISEAFNDAMNDAAVKAVFLEVDSPGGEVSGLFDLVDNMTARVGEKPIHAHCNELSASAAYAITTVADHISTPRTGIIGSVGAIIIHREASKFFDKEGLKVTIVRAGERKAETNPYEPLSDKAKDWLQKEVNYVRNIFIATVARNRGVEDQIIRDTAAVVYSAPGALEVGLVDAVMSTEEAAAHLMAVLG